MIQQIKAAALARAAQSVVGEDEAAEIERLYLIIDDAVAAGYDQGVSDALQSLQKETDEAFVTGFGEGSEQGHDEGYDMGYLDGVRDARAAPEVADDTVRAILGEDLDEDDDRYNLSEFEPKVNLGVEEDFPGDYYYGYDEDFCGDPRCPVCGATDGYEDQ